MNEIKVLMLKKQVGMLNAIISNLERLSADLSSPASCSETSEARTEPDAHNKNTPRVRHSEAEGRGGVQRVLDRWKREEGACRQNAKNSERRLNLDEASDFLTLADDLKSKREEVEAALGTQPLTESEAGEDESCLMCHNGILLLLGELDQPYLDFCPHCKGTGSRRKRSESRND